MFDKYVIILFAMLVSCNMCVMVIHNFAFISTVAKDMMISNSTIQQNSNMFILLIIFKVYGIYTHLNFVNVAMTSKRILGAMLIKAILNCQFNASLSFFVCASHLAF